MRSRGALNLGAFSFGARSLGRRGALKLGERSLLVRSLGNRSLGARTGSVSREGRDGSRSWRGTMGREPSVARTVGIGGRQAPL
jgi:hypothetical protein